MSVRDSAFYKLTPESKREKLWWRVAKAHFEGCSLARHQIDSYNKFIREKLPEIITDTDFEYTKNGEKFIVSFENVYVKKPFFTETSGTVKKLYPYDCRARNLSYMCQISADITSYQIGEDEKVTYERTYNSVDLGSIPCMVNSDYCNLRDKDAQGRIKEKECPKDPGGYFIIKGNEKVLISQDRMAHNEIFVFKGKAKDTIKIPIPGTDKKQSLPCEWYAEVRSYTRDYEPNITSAYIRLSKQQLDKGLEQRLYMEIPGVKCPVPWPIVFMALGVTSKEEMINYVCNSDDIPILTLLLPSLETPNINTQQEALEYLSTMTNISQKEKKMSELKKILRQKLFQNITDTRLKRYYLGYMTYKILATAIGRRKEDDRDHCGRKRVDTAGSLINNLFKSIWKHIIREATNNLIKKRNSDLDRLFKNKLTNSLKPPFSKGNWVATKTAKATKAGVSQTLNKHNYISTLSNMRRVATPSDKNSKIVRPRHLHNSHWNLLCPVETPEGQSTGLVKNMTFLSEISIGSDDEQIMDWLKISKMVSLMLNNKTIPKNQDTKVFVNGRWVGTTEKCDELVIYLRTLKRDRKLQYDTSISANHEGVCIYTDEGRLISPVFVVNNGKICEPEGDFIWNDLIESGTIEYLDASETETLYISEYPWKLDNEHTHSLIHPSFLLGVSGSTAPFSDHNQSPRNVYQAAMGKQAISVYALNYLHRFDTIAHVMCYPQKPMVSTVGMRLLDADSLSGGQNLIIAVQCAAYNQEDSVILNKRSIDNGMLRSFGITTYSDACHRKGNVSDDIKNPKKIDAKETRLKGYSNLDDDGISKENTPLCKRDVIIGKVNTGSSSIPRDISVVVKSNGLTEDSVVETEEFIAVNNIGSAIVDKAILTKNEDSFRSVKVRVRQMRVPQIGDKVASRSAQKGINGLTEEPENMPYSKKTGIVPDLIMNPAAFPSRMTISQILESVCGKACTLTGANIDCTPFDPEFHYQTVCDELKKHGFDQYGEEVMINGYTGEEMECTIFMGPTYYQRLKHMVDDKIHSRDQNGPRETLTRQPVEGRKRGGGFRMGEMETWCGISHGASKFLIDRLVNNSDGYEMHVCDYCGNTAIASIKSKRYECKRCQQDIAISKIRVPYAYKLLMQELQACGFGLWFDVDTEKTLVPFAIPSH